MAKGCQSQYKHVASAEDCTWCDKSDGYGGLYAKRMIPCVASRGPPVGSTVVGCVVNV